MSRIKNLKRSLVLIALLLIGTSGAWAQDEKGNIFVRVTDSQGTPLPGVTLEIVGQGAPQLQVTGAAGEARFLGLSPGQWSLSAALEGYSKLEYPNVDVRVARNTSLDVQLSEAIGEVITVTSESPLLDERRITSGTTISRVELEKIPTARDPWSVVNQTPGVMVDRINVGGNESGQQAVFLGPGVSDEENAFLVDGVEVTDMAAIGASSGYYDFDQFAEMQFGTGGSDTAKANAGVSVNLVTKRGTNEFRGSSRILRTDDDMFGVFQQDTPILVAPDSDLAPGQESFVGNSIDQVTDFGVEAGGPAVRDRLWFWGSFGQNDIKNRTGGETIEDVQPDDTVLENTAFKFNAQISQSNSALGTWNNGDKQKAGRNAGPTRPAPTTWDQRGPTAIIKLEDTHIFNSNFFLTGNWSKVDGGFSLTSQAVKAAGSLEAAPEALLDADNSWQNSFLSGSSSRPSEEFKLSGSYFFSSGQSVSHELKFGGRARDFEAESPFHWAGRDVFHIDSGLLGTANPQVVAHRGETPLITQDYTSFWVQDTISWGNFTLNAGLRYDEQEGRNEPFSIPGNPAFPNLLPELSFDGNDAGGFKWETISPRVGITYALGEERKTLLRGSFSRFADQLQTDEISRTNPLSDAYATFFFADANGDSIWQQEEQILQLADFSGFNPTDPTAVSSPNQTDPGLDAPVTDELIIGAEHSFLPEFVVGLSLTVRNTSDIMEERDLVVDGSGVTRLATVDDYVRDGVTTGVLPGGTPFAEPLYALNPGLSYSGGTLLLNGDRERDYAGANLNFVKRLSNHWMLRGYVNYGETEWDIPGSFFVFNDPNDTAPLDTGQDSDEWLTTHDNDGDVFVIKSSGSGAKGDVLIQSSWQVNVNGMYQIAPDRPWGFNVAGNVFAREGYPLPYYNSVTGSDGRTRSIEVSGVTDAFRVDDVVTFDARLEKEFAATSDVSFTVSLDAFNVFDESTELQRERQLNSNQPNYLRETLSPRIYRIGVRLNWR